MINTREYVRKYNLNKTDKFSHYKFTRDLAVDFNELCIKNRVCRNDVRFEQSVKEIRKKYQAIVNKTNGVVEEKVWKYFYASVVSRRRNEFKNQNTVIGLLTKIID